MEEEVGDVQDLVALGPNARWLVENSAVADRAYADMMAERARHPAPTGICLECEA